MLCDLPYGWSPWRCQEDMVEQLDDGKDKDTNEEEN